MCLANGLGKEINYWPVNFALQQLGGSASPRPRFETSASGRESDGAPRAGGSGYVTPACRGAARAEPSFRPGAPGCQLRDSDEAAARCCSCAR